MSKQGTLADKPLTELARVIKPHATVSFFVVTHADASLKFVFRLRWLALKDVPVLIVELGSVCPRPVTVGKPELAALNNALEIPETAHPEWGASITWD